MSGNATSGPGGVRVTFVRHGESVSNVSGRWQGQGDSPLSDHGRSQAQRVGERLANERFHHVESSDLVRALDTARYLRPDAVGNRSFREIDVGRWEGLTRAEVLERFPEEIQAIVEGRDIRIGGGESWADAAERAQAAVDRLRARMQPGEHAAVFTHGGIITSLFLGFVGVRSRRPQPLGYIVNTSVSTVRFEGDRRIVERYNDATHLAPKGAWSIFSGDDALVSMLAWDASGGSLDPERVAAALEGIDAILVAGAGEDLAATLASDFGVPVSRVPDDAALDDLPSEHAGRRVLVVAPAARVQEAATRAVARLADRVDLAPPTVGSLTHLAQTRGTRILVDYSAGPLIRRD